MESLHVSLFGCVRVFHNEAPSEMKLSHSIQGLLAYLILFRHRAHPRDVLAEVFWGYKDPQRSRCSLNTALWQLRNALEPAGTPRGTYLMCDHPGEVGFNPHSPFWLDVQAFQENTNPIIDPQPDHFCEAYLLKLENAVTLYQGDLLEGFYDDWVLREREHWRAHYLSTLNYMMRIYHDRSDYERSITCGQKILELDPLREETHRYLMQLFIEIGQRARAVRQYEICRESLDRELHIEPMIETTELHHWLIAHPLRSSSGIQTESSSELQQALAHLHEAQSLLKQACDQFSNSIKMVEGVIENRTKISEP